MSISADELINDFTPSADDVVEHELPNGKIVLLRKLDTASWAELQRYQALPNKTEIDVQAYLTFLSAVDSEGNRLFISPDDQARVWGMGPAVNQSISFAVLAHMGKGPWQAEEEAAKNS